jgi:hypothetical protein
MGTLRKPTKTSVRKDLFRSSFETGTFECKSESVWLQPQCSVQAKCSTSATVLSSDRMLHFSHSAQFRQRALLQPQCSTSATVLSSKCSTSATVLSSYKVLHFSHSAQFRQSAPLQPQCSVQKKLSTSATVLKFKELRKVSDWRLCFHEAL